MRSTAPRSLVFCESRRTESPRTIRWPTKKSWRAFTPDARAIFLFDPPRPVAEPVDQEYPFVLLSGRGTSAQWHTNTRTGKSAVLRTLYPANAYAEIHPTDAAKLGLVAHGPVAIVSRRARIECTAVITRTVQPGQIFIPMR